MYLFDGMVIHTHNGSVANVHSEWCMEDGNVTQVRLSTQQFTTQVG